MGSASSTSEHQSQTDESSSLSGRDPVDVFEAARNTSSNDSTSQGSEAGDARIEIRATPVVANDPEEGEQAVELPFCFMTLALNAMPFVTHHAPVFDEVGQILSKRAQSSTSKFPEGHRPGGSGNPDRDQASPPPAEPRPESFWEWHVVEGVAAGRANHGASYSRRRIPGRYFDPETGLSVDGTTQYLDTIVAGSDGVGDDIPSSSPRRRVHVHRRCGGGKKRGSQLAPDGDVGEGAAGIPGGEGSSTPTRRPVAARPETAGRMSGKNEPRDGGVSGRRGGSDDRDGDDGGGVGSGSTSCLWRDKIQMVNAVAFSLENECLLVQVDADELWTADQLVRLRDMFLLERRGSEGGGTGDGASAGGGMEQHPVPGRTGAVVEVDGDAAEDGVRGDEDYQVQRQHQQQPEQESRNDNHRRKRECAYFDCHFFVGADLVTVTENGWGHSTADEWLRAWVFRPRESVWLQHAPPELARHEEATGWKLLARDQCIGREETRERGLVFTHYAYVLEEQVGLRNPRPWRRRHMVSFVARSSHSRNRDHSFTRHINSCLRIEPCEGFTQVKRLLGPCLPGYLPHSTRRGGEDSFAHNFRYDFV